MDFAKKYRNWSVEDWKKVIWSDESKFMLFGSDGRQYCWKKPGEPLRSPHVKPTVKFGGGNIMVWGCFSAKGLGPLVRIEGKMNHKDYINILEDNLLPFIQENYSTNHYKFQDDNAPVHTAKNVKKWMSEKGLILLEDWPSQSPDLNIVKRL